MIIGVSRCLKTPSPSMPENHERPQCQSDVTTSTSSLGLQVLGTGDRGKMQACKNACFSFDEWPNQNEKISSMS